MKTNRIPIALLIAAAYLSPSFALKADAPRHDVEIREGGRKTDGPRMEPGFFQQLYPAELVMRHADAIGLSDDQRAAIKIAMPRPGKGVDRERQIVEARQLEQMLKSDKVDEAQALAQLDKLLKLEDGFKRRQLHALIKIKNILTRDQRLKLDDLRRKGAGRGKDEGPRVGLHEGGSQTNEEPKIAPLGAVPR